MENFVRGWLVVGDGELGNDGLICTGERGDVAFCCNLLKVGGNQPASFTGTEVGAVLPVWEARVGRGDVHQAGHDEGVPEGWSVICDGRMTAGTAYWTVTALLIVPLVVLAGMMPTNELVKLPRAKLTAPRPETGGEANCQHSKRDALLAAEMAVILNEGAWLTTPWTTASVVARMESFIAACLRRRLGVSRVAGD